MKKLLVFPIVLCSFFSFAQKIASFSIELSMLRTDVSIPVTAKLDKYTFIHDSSLVLFEVKGKQKIHIPFQIKDGIIRTIHWLIAPDRQTSKNITYVLEQGKPHSQSIVAAKNTNGAITFQNKASNLLRYQYQTVYPQKGIDTNYRRSGFIHPLWTPHGQILTAIQPKDHYHHYGIWNPWTHTVFEKDTVDFWNIKGHQGTVRFAKIISQTNGSVFSEIETLHEHVQFKKNGTEKVALNELQTIRVYNPDEKSDYFIVDITSQLNCATESPFLILAYRYAGLGWRATEEWTKENCEVFTSEGTDRKNTDGIKARWIVTQGVLDNDYGGMVMMSYPANYNHPEPLRIWDEKANGGRGDMFANFAPTKDKDWLLQPGRTYVLKYRLLVFNGKMTKEKAEAAWKNFATADKIF